MNEDAYVFDTYALIEIIRGNKNYKAYENARVIITEIILAELCLSLIRELGRVKSFSYVDKYSEFVKAVGKEVIKKAMVYRFEHPQRNLSMADCIGYCLAKGLGIKFLTGDKEFKDVEGVEFVK